MIHKHIQVIIGCGLGRWGYVWKLHRVRCIWSSETLPVSHTGSLIGLKTNQSLNYKKYMLGYASWLGKVSFKHLRSVRTRHPVQRSGGKIQPKLHIEQNRTWQLFLLKDKARWEKGFNEVETMHAWSRQYIKLDTMQMWCNGSHAWFRARYQKWCMGSTPFICTRI